jgi:capsular exopolysaccharide synthesis family protein
MIQAILVTSPNRAEGKSLVAANLAVCFAQLEVTKKVALLDCNFKHPALPWYLSYQEGEGLGAVLSLKSLLNDIIIKHELHNLEIIPAGWMQVGSSALICDEKFAMFFEYLKSQYDYIIVDSSSLQESVDPCVLASLCDIVLFVINQIVTPKHSVEQAHRRILKTCHRRVYAVLNNVEEPRPIEWRELVPDLARRILLSFRIKRSSAQVASFSDDVPQKKAG